VAGALTWAAGAGDVATAKDSRVADKVRGQHIAAASPPLQDPEVRAAGAATHMRDEDLVFGVTLAGHARAYPWWVAKNFHVVNDTVGGVPLVVAFCEQCTGAGAFRRQVGGRLLSFEVAGVYNGTIILRDRQTRTLWAPFSGRALEGPLAGRTLERIPLALTRWDIWTARHPRADVVWAPEAARGGHGSWYEPGKWGIVSEMGHTLQAWDPRLPENTLVYGIEDGALARSYPLARVRAEGGVLNDQLGERAVVVVARGPLEVAAYERAVNGRRLTFRASTGLHAMMSDEETGSDWSADGTALEGPLRGARLATVDGYLVEWHAWSAYNPGAGVFGLATPAGPAAPPAGTAFPPLRLPGLKGPPRPVPLAGSLNLVILWAAWCPSCAVEMPRLQRLADEYAGRGLAAVGIAVHLPEDDHEKQEVERFVATAGVRFPTFLVDEAAYDRLDALGRSGGGPGIVLPTVFVVDERGLIVSVFRGKEVEALPATVAHLRPAAPPRGPAAPPAAR
jgi:thiol-disulfide isomerase/thioredoxin